LKNCSDSKKDRVLNADVQRCGNDSKVVLPVPQLNYPVVHMSGCALNLWFQVWTLHQAGHLVCICAAGVVVADDSGVWTDYH
jgi:hypothetical protein